MSEPVKLSEVVGRGYDEFWKSRHMYRLCKGSKGSKKSKTTALWFIFNIMKYPGSNALVIRKTYSSLRDSAYTDLLWAIDRLGVGDFWTASLAPLRLTYNARSKAPQTILFKGLDDATKLASITVRQGYLCWVWFEEFSEITDPMEFEKVTMSIRGYIPPETGLFKQFTCTFNPWSEHLWFKERFFDHPSKDVFAMTSTYKDNEFLDEADIARYEEMRERNPRAARVICDGEWGIAEGQIYENWEVSSFNVSEIVRKENIQLTFGLDFGYAMSYNAFIAIAVDPVERKMWIFEEMYAKGLSNIDIAKRITRMGYASSNIIADCAEPKSIYELRNGLMSREKNDYGEDVVMTWKLPNIRPAMKGPDSRKNGIQRIQSYRIIVHSTCLNTIMELSNYCYAQDQYGNYTGEPIKDFDHLMDAMRYAMEKFFVRGHGHVAEARGRDAGDTARIYESDENAGDSEVVQVVRRPRRVVSTL